MRQNLTIPGILFAALLLHTPLAAPQTAAQDTALVRELLSLSGAEKQYDQVMTIMMDSIRAGFRQGFADAVRDKPVDAAKRERAQAIAERHMQQVLRDFSAEIRRVMPYDKLVSEVYAPLYLKHFSGAELADAIAFFRSPTGRKFADATPQLMQDSARIVNERYMPQLSRYMGQQMQEHMQRMIEEIRGL